MSAQWQSFSKQRFFICGWKSPNRRIVSCAIANIFAATSSCTKHFFSRLLILHLWSKRFCESYNACLYVINDTLYVRMLSVIQCIFVYYGRYNVCLCVINDTMYVRMLSIKAKNFNSRIKHFVFNSISLEKAFISNYLKLSHFWTAELLPYQ